jgi:hypothetical protein
MASDMPARLITEAKHSIHNVACGTSILYCRTCTSILQLHLTLSPQTVSGLACFRGRRDYGRVWYADFRRKWLKGRCRDHLSFGVLELPVLRLRPQEESMPLRVFCTIAILHWALSCPRCCDRPATGNSIHSNAHRDRTRCFTL